MSILRVFCLVLLLLSAATADARTSGKPNFLILFLDNVGYGDLGCYGNREVRTPNIDRLAAEGVRCTDFYIASPSCTPSRGAILTGRHPERTGLNWQLNFEQNVRGIGLPLEEIILPQYLKAEGYATAAFGKWNLGFGPGARPTDRGFDEFLGHASGNIHYYKHLYHGQNDMRRGTKPIDLRGQYSTDIFADAAVKFIRQNRGQPWLVYLPFNAAHFVSSGNVEPGEKVQWQVPAKYLESYGYAADENDEKKRFRGVLTALDDAVGRVLRAVDDTKQRDRTFVLLISDNGAFMLKGRGLEVQSNAPLRAGGVTTYEGGVRVPAIFRWPKEIKPGSCNAMLSSLDVVPTLVAAAGGKLPDDRTFDGTDMLPVLRRQQRFSHAALHWVWNQGKEERWRGMRKNDWKIVRRTDKEPWQLYDVAQDLGESTDLASDKPELLQQLINEFNRWHETVRVDRERLR